MVTGWVADAEKHGVVGHKARLVGLLTTLTAELDKLQTLPISEPGIDADARAGMEGLARPA